MRKMFISFFIISAMAFAARGMESQTQVFFVTFKSSAAASAAITLAPGMVIRDLPGVRFGWDSPCSRSGKRQSYAHLTVQLDSPMPRDTWTTVHKTLEQQFIGNHDANSVHWIQTYDETREARHHGLGNTSAVAWFEDISKLPDSMLDVRRRLDALEAKLEEDRTKTTEFGARITNLTIGQDETSKLLNQVRRAWTQTLSPFDGMPDPTAFAPASCGTAVPPCGQQHDHRTIRFYVGATSPTADEHLSASPNPEHHTD